MKETVIKAFSSAKETTEPEVSKIIGNVPQWLQGQLIRNGPGKFDFENFTMNHLFDGYNLLTKFEIQGGDCGEVKFSSKFLQSEAHKKAELMQKPVISEYSTRAECSDGKKSVLARVISTFFPEQTDNCPFICSTGMGPNPIVVGDTGFLFEVDRCTLDCLSRHDPVKEFGVHCQSSHPLIDYETGHTYNVGISIFSGAKWNVLKYPPATNSKLARDSIKKVEILTSFPCRNKTFIPWLHSFGMSKNYIICIDQPSYFNVAKVIGSIFSKGITPRDMNEWRPEYKNRFYFISKETGKVNKAEIISKEAFFFYHILNCFEQDGHLVIDVFCMPNFKIADSQTIANLRSGYRANDKDSPTLQRFVIPLFVSDIKKCSEHVNLVTINSTATAVRTEGKIIVEPEVLSENRMEFSTFNKRLVGQSLRYIWATGAYTSSPHQHKIFKFDFQTKQLLTWQCKENQFVGEALFVSNPESNEQNEDDGVIINVVANMEHTEGEKDFMLFLDAKTLTELGRAYFSVDMPLAIHGVYIPG